MAEEPDDEFVCMAALGAPVQDREDGNLHSAFHAFVTKMRAMSDCDTLQMFDVEVGAYTCEPEPFGQGHQGIYIISIMSA